MFSFFLYSAFSPSSPFKYTKQSTPFYNMRQQRSSEFIFCFVMCICTNYQTILCVGRRITRVPSVGTEKPCSSSRTQRRRRRRWDCTTSVLILSATTGGRSSGCTILSFVIYLVFSITKVQINIFTEKMTNPKGYRRGTRDMFSRAHKKKGVEHLSTYLKNYKIGDIVDVKGEFI